MSILQRFYDGKVYPCEEIIPKELWNDDKLSSGAEWDNCRKNG